LLKALLDNALRPAARAGTSDGKRGRTCAACEKPDARKVRQFAAIAIAQQMCLISLAGLLK